MTSQRAAQNGMSDEIQRISIFVVQNDPAISSYLNGLQINTTGRVRRDADSSAARL
jgi:hypothetical protein